MSTFSFRALGQLSNFSISGESTFWGFGNRGVSNHNFSIRTLPFGSTGTIYNSNPFPMITSANPCGIYSGTVTLRSDNPNLQIHQLRVMPTTVNNNADYLNGVSTIDLLRLSQHLSGSNPFTNGFQKLAGEANNDYSLNSSDQTHIHQLILGISSSLNRTSWEWIEQSVNTTGSAFFNNPWYYTLSANGWPVNIGGKIFGERRWNNLSTNQISNPSNNWQYFTFKSVKVGDVIGTSNPNSWICVPGTYLNEDNIENRSKIDYNSTLEKDDKIILKLRVEKYEDLIGIQIPLNLDEDVFSLEGITFINGFNPWYHYSAERQTLMIMDYATDGITPININDGEICKITLKVKITKNISQLENIFLGNDWASVELVNKDMEYSNSSKVHLVFESIVPSEVRLKVANYGNSAVISTEKNETTHLQITSIDGQVIESRKISLLKGINQLDLPELTPGLYIISTTIGNRIFSLKFVK